MRGGPSQEKAFFDPLDIPYQSEILKADNKSLKYIRSVRSGPINKLIVFIHGAPGSWDAWKAFLADFDLRSDYTLISVDRSGYGNSDYGIAETSIINHANLIQHLITQSSPKELILVGHSYGGPIAAYLGIMNKDINPKIVMCAPVNDPYNEPMKWYSVLANWSISKWLCPNYINTATKEKMSHSKALQEIEHIWAEIDFDVIHIHGDKDKIAPYEENILFSQKNIPEEHLNCVTLKNENHFIIWNKAETIKKHILTSYK